MVGVVAIWCFNLQICVGWTCELLMAHFADLRRVNVRNCDGWTVGSWYLNPRICGGSTCGFVRAQCATLWWLRCWICDGSTCGFVMVKLVGLWWLNFRPCDDSNGCNLVIQFADLWWFNLQQFGDSIRGPVVVEFANFDGWNCGFVMAQLRAICHVILRIVLVQLVDFWWLMLQVSDGSICANLVIEFADL